jgi:hypothetical protein
MEYFYLALLITCFYLGILCFRDQLPSEAPPVPTTSTDLQSSVTFRSFSLTISAGQMGNFCQTVGRVASLVRRARVMKPTNAKSERVCDK